MKLRTKIFALFASALVLVSLLSFFGLTAVLDNLSTMLMKRQAEQLSLYLQHIYLRSAGPASVDSVRYTTAEEFNLAKHVADEGGNFDVGRILLLDPDFRVEAAYPVGEVGGDYSGHEDIRLAFEKSHSATVIEKAAASRGAKGVSQTWIDVVSYFKLADGSPRVLEVKLDFAKSISMLEGQYAVVETTAIVAGILVFALLLTLMLIQVTRTAVRPVLMVTRAMERVGRGELDVELPEASRDEFGMLSRQFNDMVRGLREKLQLYKYVSKGTINAARNAVAGSGGHATSKEILSIFFSDIRGFTTYSEPRDPSDVVKVLNRVLSIQAAIIERHQGEIDKFVGDEVMATFKDPRLAVMASIEIQRELFVRSAEIDALRVGIGIFEGMIVKGDIGSDEIRNYTVIGDSVNTAARLQASARGGEVLLPRPLAEKDEFSGALVTESRGRIVLKGKENEIEVVSVRSYRPPKELLAACAGGKRGE